MKTYCFCKGFTGSEGISRLFQFDLELLSENSSIAFKDIIGQNVTLRIALPDDKERYFNGFVSRFVQTSSDVRFTHYQMEVVPWLWFLTRNADCRIFQKCRSLTYSESLQRSGIQRLQIFRDRHLRSARILCPVP